MFAASGSAPAALRLHFGMSGSLVARKVKSNEFQKKTQSGVPPWKQNNAPSLRLYFLDGPRPRFGGAPSYVVVEAWEAAVTYPTSASKARSKLTDLSPRDACSALFNAQVVFRAMRESGNHMIVSDALLDQEIFPGVGNIIKVESLHKSGIDPRRSVGSLADAELRRLVRHARKFSVDWLRSGRAGPKLVYNQTACGTCRGTTVKMQKIGGSGDGGGASGAGRGHSFIARVTFWCTACQPLATGAARRPLETPSIPDGSGRPHGRTLAGNKPQAQCPQHGLSSVKLCRARKGKQENALRIFYTCKIRGCPFFNWADAAFPRCRCGRRTVLRVSKTAASGGRWFLCCASGDKSTRGNGSDGCGHFEWASDVHLSGIRPLLTPLL